MSRNLPLLVAVGGVGAILLAMLAGPALSPPEFDWLRHTSSEQAAQGSPGAWAMRAGFAAYGLATALAAWLDRGTRPLVRAALGVFGLGLVAAAIWSNAPIIPGLAADMAEDWRHSVASGVVGTGFACACAARLFAPGGAPRDALAWAGLAAAVLVPMAMMASDEFRGLLQRGMFGLSYVFVIREFLR